MTAKAKSRGNGQGSVYKRGTSWMACVVVCNPDRRTKTKGGFATKREALAALPDLRRALLGLTHPADTTTFAALYDRWFPYYEPRVSSMSGHAAAYKHFAAIHRKIFTTITADDLQGCVNSCGRGKRTKEDMRTLAHQLYKYAGAIQLTDKNYAQYIFCGNDEKGTHEPFSMAEVERIAAAAAEGAQYADYVLALIYLGYRPNELLGLSKSAYDAERKCFVAGSKTEAGKNRIVTISPKIQAIIDHRMAASGDLVFPKLDSDREMTVKYFRLFAFDPLMQSLGIVGRVPYSCRHTFANLLKNVTGSDTDKARLMGHADASMTKYYQSADYDSIRAITERI